jgi:hypothetical protein
MRDQYTLKLTRTYRLPLIKHWEFPGKRYLTSVLEGSCSLNPCLKTGINDYPYFLQSKYLDE